jgi:hypothetical protein
VYGSTVAPPPTVTPAHRAPAALQSAARRALAGAASRSLGATSVATLGVVSKDTAVSAEAAPLMNLWGHRRDGAPTGTLALELPPEGGPPGRDHRPRPAGLVELERPRSFRVRPLHSQASSRVATRRWPSVVTKSGNLLAAAVVYYGLTYSVPRPSRPTSRTRNTYIAVRARRSDRGHDELEHGRLDAGDHHAVFSDGKTIYQNGVTPIGRLTGANFGPPMSAPMIDSVGNVWFVSSIELSGPARRAEHGPAARGSTTRSTFSSGSSWWPRSATSCRAATRPRRTRSASST